MGDGAEIKIILSHDLRVYDLNAVAMGVFDFQRDKVIGKNIFDLLEHSSVVHGLQSKEPLSVTNPPKEMIVFIGNKGGKVFELHCTFSQWCSVDSIGDTFLLTGCVTENIEFDSSPEMHSYCVNVLGSDKLSAVKNYIGMIGDRDILHDTLFAIVSSLPGNAHIKKASDFKYMYSNAQNLKLLRCESMGQLNGKTVQEITYLPQNFVDKINKTDKEIISSRQSAVIKGDPFLDAEHKLVVHSITKIPLYDFENKPLGILTLAVDDASLRSPVEMRALYKQLCVDDETANKMYLRHYGLEAYVKVTPGCKNSALTEREIDCLFLLSEGKTNKEVAKILEIAPKTVEHHLESIREKMQCDDRKKVAEKFLHHIKSTSDAVSI